MKQSSKDGCVIRGMRHVVMGTRKRKRSTNHSLVVRKTNIDLFRLVTYGGGSLVGDHDAPTHVISCDHSDVYEGERYGAYQILKQGWVYTALVNVCTCNILF